jgi:hypothetical protein
MRQSIQRAVPNGDYSRLIPIGLISNEYRPKLAQVPVNWSNMTIVLNIMHQLHALKLIKLMYNQIN